MKLRAVLDTNVLLGQSRHELLFLAQQRVYTLIWSSFLVGECVGIRTELAIKHGQDRDIYRARINAFIHEVTQAARMVDYTKIPAAIIVSGSKTQMMSRCLLLRS